MYGAPIATCSLILLNIVVSIAGFYNLSLFEGYKFQVDKILVKKDFIRLLSSGFLHTGWLHLFFNMWALYSFGNALEAMLGPWSFLLIYFASLLGGGAFSLIVHRHHADYSSAGASGAVCGLIFAFIALLPGADMGLFLLPIRIPGWLFGLLFVIISIYGIRSQRQNIGHDAHLGGAVIGMLVAILLHPEVVAVNYVAILIVLVPAVIFTYIIITRPQALLVDNLFFKEHAGTYTLDDRYNLAKGERQRELDRLLEKISRSGIHSLSVKERQRLEEYSK